MTQTQIQTRDKILLNRRHFAVGSLAVGGSTLILTACGQAGANEPTTPNTPTRDNRKTDFMNSTETNIDWANLTRREWQERLTDEEFYVLRKEGTERPFSSPLNDEKRAGTFVCSGCALPLFKTDTKFDSGTGWPSFFDHIAGAINTKRDFKLIVPRTEYHCARCGGHQGHVFKDGPRPTGLRYCNNGVALDFIPDEA